MELRCRGTNLMEDVCLWKNENGDFKPSFVTSQTWNLIRVKAPEVQWSKAVWFPESTPRFAFLTWIAIRNRLATGDRILKWNPLAVTTCWLCKEEMESRNHLFFDCSYSKEVWKATVGKLMSEEGSYGWDRVLQTIIHGLREKIQTMLLRYSFQAVIYALWLERNARRVGEKEQPAACMIARLEKLVRNRVTSLRKRMKQSMIGQW
ncbi:uncharacterized protein LOC130511360 [Raphanus sativus]|uniref:Uncharacterized protein LOC130511360 n=1 Tax=Raphanus sativus TaxID=3726 RepID=A0A9W3DKR6_RAPSA|nr:uncharacterized protein LOC130511360 [Raphanus sativus]